jgi:hypothetical protein
MKFRIASLGLAFALSAAPVFSGPAARFGIGLAGMGQLPIGAFSENAGPGIGGLASLEAGAYPGLAITARSGYARFAGKNDFAVRHVPVLAGLKASAVDGLYMALEAGAVFTDYGYRSNGFAVIADETRVGWNIGMGSMRGPLDVRLSLNVWDAAHARESTTVGLSVGVLAFPW